MRILRLAILLALALIPQLAFSQPLKVVSYNVWGLPSPLLRHAERFKELPSAINSLDADVVLIQEAFNRESRELTRLPRFPYHAWGPSGRFLRFGSGLLILSRYPIAASAETTYSKCGGFDCFANKGALFARILVPGTGPVNVFDTHMNANGHPAARMSQASELAGFVQRYEHGLPTIVGGDFNGDGPTLMQKITGALFVRDAHAEYVGHRSVLTREELDGFTADAARNPFLSPSDPSYRLDHVFLGKGLKVLGDSLIFDGKFGKVLSDHFGVRVVVDLPDQPTG